MNNPVDEFNAVLFCYRTRRYADNCIFRIANFKYLCADIGQNIVFRPFQSDRQARALSRRASHDTVSRHIDMERLPISAIGRNRNDRYFSMLVNNGNRVQRAYRRHYAQQNPD